MKKGASRPTRNTSIEALAVEILRESKKPLSTSEITQSILKRRSLASINPRKTVYAVLHRSEQIKRVGPGLFTLWKD